MKLSRIVIKVKDYRASFEFYKNILGLKLSSSWQRQDSWGAIFNTGTGFIEILWQPSGIGLEESNYIPQRDKIDIFFEVHDIDILYKRLSDSGVKISGKPQDMPWGYRIFKIKDPDNISIVISQPLA